MTYYTICNLQIVPSKQDNFETCHYAHTSKCELCLFQSEDTVNLETNPDNSQNMK